MQWSGHSEEDVSLTEKRPSPVHILYNGLKWAIRKQSLPLLLSSPTPLYLELVILEVFLGKPFWWFCCCWATFLFLRRSSWTQLLIAIAELSTENGSTAEGCVTHKHKRFKVCTHTHTRTNTLADARRMTHRNVSGIENSEIHCGFVKGLPRTVTFDLVSSSMAKR